MITKNFIVILLLYIGRFCCYCASSDEQINYDKKQLTDDIKFNLELEEANEIQNEKNESTESSDVIAKNLNALKELLKGKNKSVAYNQLTYSESISAHQILLRSIYSGSEFACQLICNNL